MILLGSHSCTRFYDLGQVPKQWYDMFVDDLDDIGFQSLVNSSILVKGSSEARVKLLWWPVSMMIMCQNSDEIDTIQD